MADHVANDDRPRFRPERAAPSQGRSLGLLVGLLLAVAAALAARPLWEPQLAPGVLVEVAGEVPQPGTYLLDEPTIAAAVAAAGGDPSAFADAPVPAGHRVVVDDAVATVAPPSDPLLVALPVDVNTASADALDAIPGIGRRAAEAIVAARADGPFYAVDDLRRVPGVGRSTLEALRPFVTVGDPGERPAVEPLDLNVATAEELEALPGIGPVTAARIVVDREDHGAYTRLEDLRRVRGVGPATIERLREHLVVR